jgi:DNA-binding SARP family transcriptional activator/class 3 adenylate cyclase
MSGSVALGAVGGDAVLPRGTVSLLFTDIEDSTEHLRRLRGAYGRLLADHSRLLREACAEHGGREVDTQGDAFFFVFTRAIDAARAAVELQRATASHDWPSGARLRVRVGLHTGEPEVVDGRYVGLDVHRAARICSVAHGGQVLLSRSAAELIADDLPGGAVLTDVGSVQLKGFDRPEPLSQLGIDGLGSSFPPPRGANTANDEPSPVAIAGPSDDVAATDFELLLLGPVAARRAGHEIRVTAAKHRVILATLGLRVGEAVSTDVLIDSLWGDRPPPTAAKALQVYVSELRKLIEVDPRQPRVLTSQAPGYRLSIGRESVDVPRFERLWSAGREALVAGDAARAQQLLRDALSLWRGEPLADFRFEDAFAADIRRLEELRIACLEDRFDADLAVGEHARLIPEIEALVRSQPLRERLRGQLMLALYRCGRQTDALSAYQAARDQLVDEFGIDPSPPLVALERQILQQDPALAGPTASRPAEGVTAAVRTLLVVSQSSSDLDALTRLAETITRSDDQRELVLARVVTALPDRDPTPRLREVTRALAERRDQLSQRDVRVRVAAFASSDPTGDLLKLAHHQDADLLLLDGTQTLLKGVGAIDALLRDAACDVALHLPREAGDDEQPVVVPFAGSEHDWAALELGALLAREKRRLVLVGVDRSQTGSDSSRLLATASLVIQRVGDVIAEPMLVPPGADAILAIADRGHIITGLSARFREEGIGDTRFRLARDAPGPVTFVRRGNRPGVLAPPEAITRFTWSLNRR